MWALKFKALDQLPSEGAREHWPRRGRCDSGLAEEPESVGLVEVLN